MVLLAARNIHEGRCGDTAMTQGDRGDASTSYMDGCVIIWYRRIPEQTKHSNGIGSERGTSPDVDALISASRSGRGSTQPARFEIAMGASRRISGHHAHADGAVRRSDCRMWPAFAGTTASEGTVNSWTNLTRARPNCGFLAFRKVPGQQVRHPGIRLLRQRRHSIGPMAALLPSFSSRRRRPRQMALAVQVEQARHLRSAP